MAHNKDMQPVYPTEIKNSQTAKKAGQMVEVGAVLGCVGDAEAVENVFSHLPKRKL